MDLETKIEVATEILNSLIASESLIDASENNEFLADLLFERAQVLSQDEEIINNVIEEYGPIIKTEVKK